MRRVLKIQNFDELEIELEHLEKANKIETSGVWSFYQILLHIGDFIHFSMYGYPFLLPTIFRNTVGKFLFKRILRKGEMKTGNYNPSTPKVREEGNYIATLQRCRQVVRDFRTFQGEFAAHPIFGEMDKETWERFHSMHAALHLSFAHPEFETKEISKIEEVQESRTISRIVEKKKERISKPQLTTKKKSNPSNTHVNKKRAIVKKKGKKK